MILSLEFSRLRPNDEFTFVNQRAVGPPRWYRVIGFSKSERTMYEALNNFIMSPIYNMPRNRDCLVDVRYRSRR